MHRPIDHEMNHPFHCLCSGARCAAADRFNRHLLVVVVVVVVTAAAVALIVAVVIVTDYIFRKSQGVAKSPSH